MTRRPLGTLYEWTTDSLAGLCVLMFFEMIVFAWAVLS